MALTAAFEKTLGVFRLRVRLTAGDGVTALFGASGSGKSLTLRCIAGLLRPDRGHIELDGRVLFDSERHIDLPPQKRRVGYLSQQGDLFPNMTVKTNLAAAVQEGTREQRAAAVAHALHTFRLEDRADCYPHQLSGGERQRTALARVLLSRPAALLLDEPFSALDSHLKEALEQELTEQLQHYGGPVIFVSHDRQEVCHLCETVCLIEGGQTEAPRSVVSLFTEPRTVYAARLTGWRNRIDPKFWGLPVPEGVSLVGVRETDWALSEQGLPCTVERLIPVPPLTTAVLRHEGELLYMTAQEAPVVGQTLRIRPVKWTELTGGSECRTDSDGQSNICGCP